MIADGIVCTSGFQCVQNVSDLLCLYFHFEFYWKYWLCSALSHAFVTPERVGQSVHHWRGRQRPFSGFRQRDRAFWLFVQLLAAVIRRKAVDLTPSGRGTRKCRYVTTWYSRHSTIITATHGPRERERQMVAQWISTMMVTGKKIPVLNMACSV